jgi:hypothetical protein
MSYSSSLAAAVKILDAGFTASPSSGAGISGGEDTGIQPSVHIFVGSKAPWFQITDGLPQHDERQ